MTINVAAVDSGLQDRKEADYICGIGDAVPKVCDAVSKKDTDVHIAIGTYNMNGGLGPDGTRYIRPAAGVTIRAEPGAQFIAPNEVCRWDIRNDHVSLIGLHMTGWQGIQNFASNLLIDTLFLQQSNNLSDPALDFGRKGGCTAALMNWGDPNGVMHDLTFKNIEIHNSYHHSIAFILNGADEGKNGKGTFQDVLIDGFNLIRSGSGYIRDAEKKLAPGKLDWSCAVNWDTGNLNRVTMRNGYCFDSWQSDLHFDGSWEKHLQIVRDLLIEDCLLVGAGQRNTVSKEDYKCGVYLQDGTLNRVHTVGCRTAGYMIGNENYGGVSLTDCSDNGSRIGYAGEYGCHGAVIKNFITSNNTERAFQSVGQNMDVDLTIINGPENPVLLGEMQKVIFKYCPEHAGDLARYLSINYNMTGSRFRIRSALENFDDLVQVHRGSEIDRSKFTLLGLPPVVPDGTNA